VQKSKLLTLPLLTIFLFSCGGPVSIEGDVFLVKGDGKPQPSAAKEVVFLESDSFENFLIESYLESIKEQMQTNSVLIQELCSVSSTNSKNQIGELELKLSSRTEEGSSKGITDSDGSCDLLIGAEDSAEKAASEMTKNYNSLLDEQKSKIASAEKEISTLRNELQRKINSRTNDLYNNFLKDIKIAVTGNTISITNNSNNNVRLNQDMCLQFYNEIGDPVGHSVTSSHILSNCKNYQQYDYENNGSIVEQSELELNKSVDSFGFKKGGYLAKGQTVKIGPKDRWSDPNNYFCSKTFTSSEKLKFTKQYGEDSKDWPNIFSPVSKGYKILNPVNLQPKEVCGIRSQEASRFIPLKDEVKTESGNVITYTSEHINFKSIASKESYLERSLIKEQESIIKASRKEIETINKEFSANKLISQLSTNKKVAKECKSFVEQNDSIKNKIASLIQSLAFTDQCDIDNTNLKSEFMLKSPVDLNKLESLYKVDYSRLAINYILNRIKNAPYKSSTNISGHYSIKDLPKGRYIVYSTYSDSFNNGIYLTNTEFKEDGNHDLSNTSFYEVGNLRFVATMFYANCASNACSEEDLKNTLDFSQMTEDWKSIKEYWD